MTRSLSRTLGRSVAATVALVVAGSLLAPGAAWAADAPTVTITAPAMSSAQSGLVTVEATATSDAADTVATVELYVYPAGGSRGATPVDTFTCTPPLDTTCGAGATLSWDSTGLTGHYSLQAVVTTTAPLTADSAVVDVVVSSPAPIVAVDSPTGPGPVTGTVTVAVSARTANSQIDYPASIAVVVDAGTANEVILLPVTCNGLGDRTCNGTSAWDTTAMSGSHTIDATVTTTNGLKASAATRTVTVSSPAPTVQITTPTTGASVSGTVFVDVAAQTDLSQTEYPLTVTLYADGSAVVVDSKPCLPADRACSVTLSWDATGLLGDHVLRAVVTTDRGRTAEDSVTVGVTTPPFAVDITSPAGGTVAVGAGATAVSSGVVAIGVTASTDTGQNEYPASIELFVDSVLVDTVDCSGLAQHVCTVVVHWDASVSVGSHTIAVRLTTSRDHQATSASRVLFARSGSRVSFSVIPVTPYAGRVTITGHVYSTKSGLPLAGVSVSLKLVPAVGRARVVTVRTNSAGTFVVRTRLYSINKVTAAVGNAWLAKGTRAGTLRVAAPLVCSTSALTYVSGKPGKGACSVRSLPVNTVVRLRYLYRGKWVILATGRTSTTVIKFGFSFRPRGTYSLQVVLGTNRVYVSTASRLMKVVVR